MIILDNNEYKNTELVSQFFSIEETEKENGKKKYYLTNNGFAVEVTLCHSLERTKENSEVEVPAISWDVLDDTTISLERREDLEVINIPGDFDHLKDIWVKVNNAEIVLLPSTDGGHWNNFSKIEEVWYKTYPLEIEEGTFQLKDGKFAMKAYGKYKPNLTFINTIPTVVWKRAKREDFNLPEGKIFFVKGDFFVSKKGTKCFRIKEEGKHILISDDWGGAFVKYRGGTLPEEEALYYRRASSNGGGSGYDFGVYPVGWKYQMSEEDL